MLTSSTSPVQKIVTTQKGIALDLDSVSRDSHAHSKELYLWGQTEDGDLKDGSSLFRSRVIIAADVFKKY